MKRSSSRSKTYDGIVINIVGDSMLALWAGAQRNADQKKKACLAALEIKNTVQQFNESSATTPLPTRIGLHSGTHPSWQYRGSRPL